MGMNVKNIEVQEGGDLVLKTDSNNSMNEEVTTKLRSLSKLLDIKQPSCINGTLNLPLSQGRLNFI